MLVATVAANATANLLPLILVGQRSEQELRRGPCGTRSYSCCARSPPTPGPVAAIVVSVCICIRIVKSSRRYEPPELCFYPHCRHRRHRRRQSHPRPNRAPPRRLHQYQYPPPPQKRALLRINNEPTVGQTTATTDGMHHRPEPIRDGLALLPPPLLPPLLLPDEGARVAPPFSSTKCCKTLYGAKRLLLLLLLLVGPNGNQDGEMIPLLLLLLLLLLQCHRSPNSPKTC